MGTKDILRDLPSSFFKYRGIDGDSYQHVMEILFENKVYFSPPNKFNDPFEFHLKLDDPTYMDIESYVQNNPNSNLIRHVKEGQSLRHIFNKAIPSHKKSFKKVIEDIKNRYGVLCLSTNVHSINLWAHYGESHRGICIEFDSSFFPFKHSKKISYAHEPAEVNFFRDILDDKKKLIEDMVYTKSINAWDKEEEYRVLSKNIGNDNFDSRAIKAIYLGCLFNNKRLLSQIKKNLPNITIIKFVKHPHKYKLVTSWKGLAKKISIDSLKD